MALVLANSTNTSGSPLPSQDSSEALLIPPQVFLVCKPHPHTPPTSSHFSVNTVGSICLFFGFLYIMSFLSEYYHRKQARAAGVIPKHLPPHLIIQNASVLSKRIEVPPAAFFPENSVVSFEEGVSMRMYAWILRSRTYQLITDFLSDLHLSNGHNLLGDLNDVVRAFM